MDTTFSYEARVLACSGCGAPLQASVQGGTFGCEYCGATNQITARVIANAIAVDPIRPADEAERLERLKAQDGKPLLPPQSIRGLVGPDGRVLDWKLEEAVAVWQQARQEVAATSSFEAAERLLFLTMILSNHFAERDDLLRQRAMFESALEVFTLPRHRQMMLGYLARCAARAGDLDAAERWLAHCDPASDDLESDSAYRFSRSFIDTARGDHRAVLQQLGDGLDDVPLMDAFDAVGALFRANAWERMDQLERAVALLKEFMGRAGAGSRRALTRMMEHYADWNLCERSYPRAEAEYREVASVAAGTRATGGVGVVLLTVGSGLVIGAVLAICGSGVTGALWLFAGADLGELTFGLAVTGVSLLLPGAIVAALAIKLRRSARKAQRLRMRGLRAYGEVRAVAPTGTKINGVPICEISLLVQMEGRAPVTASTQMMLGPDEQARLVKGSKVPVLVDPDDPTQVIIETA